MDMDNVDTLISDFICMLDKRGGKNIDASARLYKSQGSPEHHAALTIVVAVVDGTIDKIMHKAKTREGHVHDEPACAECGRDVGFWVEYHGHKPNCKNGQLVNNWRARE